MKFFWGGFGFLKYNKFSWSGVLLFLGLGLKIVGIRFQKYNKGFLLKKYGEFFLILEIESSISENIRNFFGWVILGLGLKVSQVASLYTTAETLR